MILSLLLELLPVIGPIKSILGLATDLVAEPSPVGAMGGLATTIALFNALRGHINKLVDWTDTKYDNMAWDVITSLMGVVVKIARLDKANVEAPVVKIKKARRKRK